jgi:threonylcarbamoyladenosine tRNA methylthiotransferase MtaB
MQEAFLAEGYRLVNWEDTATIRVINTCTVTAKSDSTCRRQIRLARRLDPECIVAVTGCYAQVDPDAIRAIPGVDLVLGNDEKTRLTDHIRAVAARHSAGTGMEPERQEGHSRHLRHLRTTLGRDTAAHDEFVAAAHGYTRAFLKIQNGCDSHCAYCIIPAARGPARSMPRGEVIGQVEHLINREYKEIVLTGINLGSWGHDTQEGELSDLLRFLVAKTNAVRYRLSSIEPLEVNSALLNTITASGERIAHHFHLPLQSGSDYILRRMNRPYSTEDYGCVAREIATRFPDAALGADVIVGFPGETEEHFMETCRFIETSPLTYLHVFAYSDRPGTVASGLPAKVHPEVIHERSLRLRRIGQDLRTRFQRRIEGSRQRVLVLRERGLDGRLRGVTGNYAEVLLSGDDTLMNRFVHGILRGRPHQGRWSLDDFTLEDPLT